jgi:adenine-specific DNA-methyltransferase
LLSGVNAKEVAPKAVGQIRRMVELALDPNDIVLDFFSGSATTAHAVMQMNADDGGKRKYILIQLAEECDKETEAFKAGFKTVAEIGKERIRRAGQKIKGENATIAADLDIGFRVLKVDSSNMNDVWYTPDQLKQHEVELFTAHIKDDRTAEDLLFQVMLDWGVPLSAKIEKQTIDGKAVWLVNQNDLLACFDPELSEEIIKKMAAFKPLRAVFRDDAFDDSLKHNVEQLFKVLSPGTEVKSI